MKKTTTRLAALALSLALLLTSCAGGTLATTMHLRKTEGTVGVSDGEGKELTPKDNLGLYSGYQVETQAESYAWIDLDKVKLTKLDQDSEVEINKEGKKLELDVKSGSLFFNVTEPLTDDEKSELSDKEVEKWEQKIKDSILRRDDTLRSVLNSMSTNMGKTLEINGKKYSLASFGIKTAGYFNAAENESYAYHIDGDADDAFSSGNDDKLRKMIEEDPDAVASFFTQLATTVYDELHERMESTTLSSAYKVYNDKQMQTEYDEYTKTIKKWEEKLKEMEESYYKKFAAMETALSKLQSQTNSLSSLLGG